MMLRRETLVSAVLFTLLGCGGGAEQTAPSPPSAPRASAPAVAAPAAPAPRADAASAAAAPVHAPSAPQPADDAAPLSALERVYVGAHRLGVNRVTDQARPGRVTVTKRDDGLWLEGRVEREPYFLVLSGRLTPTSPERFELEGTLAGVPDMRWAGEAPTARETRGRFSFEVKKGRSFWRLYRVNGRDCVCDDGCGNDFCYVDVERALAAD
jgi:hypothetical protein